MNVHRENLNFDCWGIVLGKMKTNKIIELAIFCPQLKTTINLLPIKIKHLQLEDNVIAINRTVYRLTVAQCFSKKHWPGWKEMSSEEHEVDHHNFYIPTAQSPGFLDFGVERRQLDTMEDLRSSELRLVNNARIFGNDMVADLTAEVTGQIARMQLREADREPSFMLAIKLTVTEGRKKPKIEGVYYSQDLALATQYLMKKIFCDRVPFQVKNLILTANEYLPTPQNFKLTVENLKVAENLNGLNMLREILTPASFPLNTLSIMNLHNQDMNFISSANILVCRNDYQERDRIEFLEHSRVHFEKYAIADFKVISTVRHWRDNGKRVGTHFSFTFAEDAMETCMFILQEHMNMIPFGDNQDNHYPLYHTLSIDNVTEIRFRFYDDEMEVMDMKASLKSEPWEFDGMIIF